jgi:hypothetical protein
MKWMGSNEIAAIARVAFGGAIVYMAVAILRAIRSRTRSDSANSQALDELWERYTRAISPGREYEARSRDLEE